MPFFLLYSLISCGDEDTIKDSAINNSDDTSSNISTDPDCGNEILEDREQCDDGNDNNNDSCLDTCILSSCGDGYVWIEEEDCDDGNTNNNDDCVNTCNFSSCGDGYLQDG